MSDRETAIKLVAQEIHEIRGIFKNRYNSEFDLKRIKNNNLTGWYIDELLSQNGRITDINAVRLNDAELNRAIIHADQLDAEGG